MYLNIQFTHNALNKRTFPSPFLPTKATFSPRFMSVKPILSNTKWLPVGLERCLFQRIEPERGAGGNLIFIVNYPLNLSRFALFFLIA